MRTMLRWVAGAAAVFGLSGCAGRDAATDAAMTLAEANYPGQLELLAAKRQKDNYRVLLAPKGDAVTRISFVVDPDPAECVPGSRCEVRFRRAYDEGLAIGAKVKALEAALARCGVITRGMESNDIVADFRTVIELDLPISNQQSALDRLTPCISAFRSALPQNASSALRTIQFRIVTPEVPGEAAPLRFETPSPEIPAEYPSYLLGVGAVDRTADTKKLRLAPDYLRRGGVNDRLADIARRSLANGSGTVPEQSAPYGMKLDLDRRTVLRSYILACSQTSTSGRPCRTDMAVAMQYDLSNGRASDIQVLRNIRNDRGAVELPPLIGRPGR